MLSVIAAGGISLEYAVEVGLKLYAALGAGYVNHKKCLIHHAAKYVPVQVGAATFSATEPYAVHQTM